MHVLARVMRQCTLQYIQPIYTIP